MSGVTGPLDVLFAQVREALALHKGMSLSGESMTVRSAESLVDGLAALSAIERHVQDMDARLAALYAANEQLHRDRDLMIERSAAWRVRAESSERHVQDMESAIEEWAFDQGYDSLSAERIAVDIRNRAAALPAREKEEE